MKTTKKAILLLSIFVAGNSFVFAAAKKKVTNSSETTGTSTTVQQETSGQSEKTKLSPAGLIKLRSEWDVKLKNAAEKIAANPPKFELHYFNEIEARGLTEEDYEKETITVDVTIPYLKQVSGFENAEIAYNLLDELHKIEESKNWGDKINGFPWSYAEEIGNNNWMLKAIAKHVDKYNFIISVVDENKKAIAKKPITYMVCYDKKFSGFVKVSDNSEYGIWNSGYSLEESDRIDFTVSLKNLNLDKLSVSVENRGAGKIAILPSEEGIVRTLSFKNLNDFDPHYFKLVGNFYELPDLDRKLNNSVFVDISDCYNLYEIYPADTTKNWISEYNIKWDRSFLWQGEDNVFFRYTNGWYKSSEKTEDSIKIALAGSSQKLQNELVKEYEAKIEETKKLGVIEKKYSSQISSFQNNILTKNNTSSKNSKNESLSSLKEIGKALDNPTFTFENIDLEDLPLFIEVICLKFDKLYAEHDQLVNYSTKKERSQMESWIEDYRNRGTITFKTSGSSLKNSETKNNELIKSVADSIRNKRYNFYVCLEMSVNTIPSSAFSNCYRLQEISIPVARNIGDNAFDGCKNLKIVSLGTVEKMGNNIFSGCDNLKNVSISKKSEKIVKDKYNNLVSSKIINFSNY